MCKKHGPTGRAARISGRSGPGQRHFIEIRAGPGRLQLSAGRSGPGHADILKSGPGRATSSLRPGHGPDQPVSLLTSLFFGAQRPNPVLEFESEIWLF